MIRKILDWKVQFPPKALSQEKQIADHQRLRRGFGTVDPTFLARIERTGLEPARV
jgi:hypothetical protein